MGGVINLCVDEHEDDAFHGRQLLRGSSKGWEQNIQINGAVTYRPLVQVENQRQRMVFELNQGLNKLQHRLQYQKLKRYSRAGGVPNEWFQYPARVFVEILENDEVNAELPTTLFEHSTYKCLEISRDS
ncbi:MAG: hypothetical protein EZS28_005639 [Streblomastix strix]|uniref:Uncharacterized protein n=1 Tax=Streblomastix strix TaxID=222440 RepID=A0A5J4WVJ4_9EUKA|nr:MAG: hypothetical protein EZS28_005639 [Streblomastix strix]